MHLSPGVQKSTPSAAVNLLRCTKGSESRGRESKVPQLRYKGLNSVALASTKTPTPAAE